MKKLQLIIILFISTYSFGQVYNGAEVFGGSGLDVPFNSAIDSKDNVYTVGLYQASLTVGTTTITSNGGNADGILTMHDPSGNPIWAKSFGGASDDVITDIAIDTNDNIYLTGYFQGAGSNSFDANPANTDDDANPYTSNTDEFWLAQQSPLMSRDCFIIKLDSNGNFVWAKQVSNPSGGAANEDSSTIEVDNLGNVYVAGTFLYADFNPDPVDQFILLANNNGANDPDGFLLKLDSNGDFVWVKTYPSTSFAKILDMEFDAVNNLYVTGQFAGTIDLDASTSGISNFTSEGNYDTFIMKLDTSQDYLWAKSFGSSANDSPSMIKVLPSGIYMGGYFSGTTNFDNGTGTNTLSPLGESDGFLSKFDTSGNFNFVYTLGGSTTGLGNDQVENIRETNGTLYVVGQFLGTSDFDNSTGVASSTSTGGSDAYILELTTSGVYQVHHTIGGTLDEDSTNLEIINNDEIMLFGSFSSSVIDLNPFSGIDNYNNITQRDVYISRFTTSSLLSTIDYSQNEISIYPNPVKDIITIKNTSNTDIDLFKIYSMTGQLIMTGDVFNNTINTSNLSSGVYMLMFSGESFKENIKIIKK